MSAAQQLRAVGQALEAWGARDFTIRVGTPGEDYVVESNERPGATVRRRLTIVDLRRLELAGQRRRRSPNGVPDSKALSNILRAIGYYVEAQGKRLVAVARGDLTFVITTMNSTGQLESETQPASIVEDLARLMFLTRPRSTREDIKGRVLGVLSVATGLFGAVASLYLLMRPERGIVTSDPLWVALLPLIGSAAALGGVVLCRSRPGHGAAVLALAAATYCAPFASLLDWRLFSGTARLVAWPVMVALATAAGLAWRSAMRRQASSRRPTSPPLGNAPTTGPPSTDRHGRRGKAGWLLMASGALLVAPATALLLYGQYSAWQLSHIVPVAEASPAELVWEQPPRNLGYGKVPLTLQRIMIPSIGVDAPVVPLGIHWEKGQFVWDTASHAVGWYGSTALPGLGSNIVMSGHISSPLRGEGSVFRRLPEVQVGDVIVLETAAGEHRYRTAARNIVAPTAIAIMAPTATETLTLITCYPDLIYSHRLIVRAEPASARTLD